MAGVLERLELERPRLVTSAERASMLEEEGVATPVAVFASRMRGRGWLLQGMRPDVADAIMGERPPTSKVRFGPRVANRRNDERWKVADTLLPFGPREMEAVR